MLERVFAGMVSDFSLGLSPGFSLGLSLVGFQVKKRSVSLIKRCASGKPRILNLGYKSGRGASGGNESLCFRKIGGTNRAHSGEIS